MILRKFLLLSFMLIMPSCLWALPLLYQEGTDYTVISKEPSKGNEVIEFFSYNCPHCFHFDPVISEYLAQKPDTVKFERISVGFGRPVWTMSAEAHLFIKALGREEALHPKIFQKIQTDNSPFMNKKDVKAFLLANGVSEEEFNKAQSAMPELMRASEMAAAKYKITSVPSIVVGGKYQVVNPGGLDSKRLSKLLAYLTKLKS